MGYLEKLLGNKVGDVQGTLNSPLLYSNNLDKVKTPLRIEKYMEGINYSGHYWD